MDTQHFKEMLEKEAVALENELRTIGKPSDTNPADWEVVEEDGINTEEGDVAEGIERREGNNAIMNKLERQLVDVKSALKKIDEGRYGICEVGGEQIETDRLEANPSAKTCKEHMN